MPGQVLIITSHKDHLRALLPPAKQPGLVSTLATLAIE